MILNRPDLRHHRTGDTLTPDLPYQHPQTLLPDPIPGPCPVLRVTPHGSTSDTGLRPVELYGGGRLRGGWAGCDLRLVMLAFMPR